MSKDIFADTQQTPLMRAPRTPSMTPTRSVKRRSLKDLKRPTSTPSLAVPVKKDISVKESNIEEIPSVLKLNSRHNEDFYYLRTRQVPLSNGKGNMQELLAQYGIYEPSYTPNTLDAVNPGGSQEVTGGSYVKQEAENKTLLTKAIYFLELLCIMLLSAFLGAMFYAQFQPYLDNTCFSSSPLQIAQDVQTVRFDEPTIDYLELENAIQILSEELKHLKDSYKKIQENVGSEVISSSQKGILEELLTADLACAGNLGSVLATPDTTTVRVTATITVLWVFSFHVRTNHRTPQTTIEGLIQEVGDCWPFEGSRGRLVLRLHQRSLVSGVSVSHIPPSVSVSGDVSSAPRLFQVWIHQNEENFENGQILGEFEYKTSGNWRQTFPLDPSITKDKLVDIIEFRFLENHGHPNYTCVYRVHIHGKTP